MQLSIADKENFNIGKCITEYLSGLKNVIEYLNTDQIYAVVEKIMDAYENERFIYVFGNGGSASTASHFVTDLNKGACETALKKFRALSLNDNTSMMLAISNDIHYDEIFRHQLQNYLSPDDLVIGISGSGNSRNVVRALEYANAKGATTIGFVGFEGGLIKQLVKHCIHVPVNDMQYVEDMHLAINHLIMRILKRSVHSKLASTLANTH